METERRNKRKQSPGLRDPNVAIKCIIALPAPNAISGGNFNCLSPKMAIKCIIALPAPNATSGGNSNCLSPKMTAKKCEKEVTRVSGLPPRTPIKLSAIDEEIDVNHETPSKSQIKVVADSPSSRDEKGDSSVKSPCSKRLYIPSHCIQTKTMRIYTKGGFCFTRKVRKYIQPESTEL